MIIVIFIASLILIYCSKYMGVQVLAPASFLSSFWCVFTIVSLIGTMELYRWDYYGVFWIYLALLFFSVCYVAGTHIHLVVSHKHENISLDQISHFSWLFLLTLIILGMLKWAFQVYTNGFSFSDFLSLDNLAEMNHEFAVNRYSGDGGEDGTIGAIIAVLNAMVYAAPLCGGFAHQYAATKGQKFIATLSLMPAFLVTMTNNTKAGMIGSLLLFFVSYTIGHFCRYKKWPQIRLKSIVFIILGFIFFLSIMLFSMMLRIGSIDLFTFAIVMQKIIVYAFGNVQSFDIWLSYYYWEQSNTFGVMTFLGIADALGLAQRVQGVYTALLGTSSNVYTAFRGIVTDFGIVGGIVFISMQGFFLRIAVNSIHSSYNPFIAVPFAMSILFFFTFGMFVSPWTYLSFIMAFILLAIYIFCAYCGVNNTGKERN